MNHVNKDRSNYSTPLAEHLRPTSLDQVIGQKHLLGPGKPIRKMAELGKFKSGVLWGPPGVGKTTILRAACADGNTHFVQLNATETKIEELRKVIKAADTALQAGKQTVVFVDECLTGDTKVLVQEGSQYRSVRIDEIVAGEYTHVRSRNNRTGEIEPKEIISRSVVHDRPMVEVRIEYALGGSVTAIRCSECHLFYTKNRGYVSAVNLTVDDQLLAHLTMHPDSTPRIVEVRSLPDREPLYDIGVQDNHNFFANGILVHNCHRWSKNQQDVLLPAVEDGRIVFFGATTEKAKHAVNSTILSRTMVYEVQPLSTSEMGQLLMRVRDYYGARGRQLQFHPDAVKTLLHRCSGDGRKLVTALETIVELNDDNTIALEYVDAAIPEKHLVFDPTGNAHYDLASAMQNCIQHSDADGAVYWLAKWIASGEDPVYICRRIMVSAFEDGGDSQLALSSAMMAQQATEQVGLPECAIPMAHAVIAIAQAGRAKIAYRAIKAAMRDVEHGLTFEVPPEMRAGSNQYVQAITKKYVFGDLVKDGKLLDG